MPSGGEATVRRHVTAVRSTPLVTHKAPNLKIRMKMKASLNWVLANSIQTKRMTLVTSLPNEE